MKPIELFSFNLNIAPTVINVNSMRCPLFSFLGRYLCGKCFPLVNNPSYCIIMDSKLFDYGVATISDKWTVTIASVGSPPMCRPFGIVLDT